jgi:predicted enzyme related to lactoylglutathione lyase
MRALNFPRTHPAARAVRAPPRVCHLLSDILTGATGTVGEPVPESGVSGHPQPLTIMNVTEIAFVGYSVADMKRAKAFYEGTMGLKKSRGFGQYEGEEQWVEYDIGAGCLALIAGGTKEWPPGSTGVAAALEVDDFQRAMDELRAKGTKFVFEPFESPMCWTAVVNDPDGNRVAIHHRKPS